MTANPMSLDERWAEHERLTAENAPPLNPAGMPDWKHPDFDRCSNDWWRLEVCPHCYKDGGCKSHFAKQFPSLFQMNVKSPSVDATETTNER